MPCDNTAEYFSRWRSTSVAELAECALVSSPAPVLEYDGLPLWSAAFAKDSGNCPYAPCRVVGIDNAIADIGSCAACSQPLGRCRDLLPRAITHNVALALRRLFYRAGHPPIPAIRPSLEIEDVPRMSRFLPPPFLPPCQSGNPYRHASPAFVLFFLADHAQLRYTDVGLAG